MELLPKDRHLLKSAIELLKFLPHLIVRPPQMEPDDPLPVDPAPMSIVFSPATAAVSLGLLESSVVVPFLPSHSPPSQPPILSLEPGCDLHEEELGEETLTNEELQRYFIELGPESEAPPPDVVSDTRVAPLSTLTTPTDTGDRVLMTLAPVTSYLHSCRTRFFSSPMSLFVPPPPCCLCYCWHLCLRMTQSRGVHLRGMA